MTAPNPTPAADPCGCTDYAVCRGHLSEIVGTGLKQQPGETAREFVRRCLALNPTLSQRAVLARGGK